MITCPLSSDTSSLDKNFETCWNEFYPTLRLIIRRQVYSFHVPSWQGQEDDIVDDILQETARRIIERTQKAERGEVPPIQFFERMAVATACNYCKDLRRRDQRLIHIPAADFSPEFCGAKNYQGNVSISEVAVENIYQEALFRLLVGEIAKFPKKQLRSLLIDLANRMHFGRQPTPLQKAFLDAGIHLQEYQQPRPENAQERGNESALLYYAYKRIAQLREIPDYALLANTV